MGQALDKRTQVVGRVKAAPLFVGELRIEAVWAVLALIPIQIIDLALAGGTYPFAGRHFAGRHVPGVLTRHGGITAACHQPAISDHGSRSSAASSGSVIRERDAGVNPISTAALVMICACLLAIAK